MGIGTYYVPPVLAPCCIFVSRPVSLSTVNERVKSRFTKITQNVMKICCKCGNCIKSQIVWLPHPVIDVQISISKTYERYSN